MICSVNGCSRKLLAKGFCSRHYTQWRKYGDPLARVLTERGAPMRFLESVTDSDGCVLWPFSKYENGYGSVWFRGRLTGAHRAACIIAHGDDPVGGQECAHSCGVRLCVNPKHIRWASASDNNREKTKHGTQLIGELNPSARLTGDQVREAIRLVSSGNSHDAVASRFGVCRETISQIIQGKTWKHIGRCA